MKKSSDKKDRLERFVRDNREDFDVWTPSDALWGRIAPALGEANQTPPLSEKKNRHLGSWGKAYFDWRIAAGVILALGVSYLFYLNNKYGVTRDPQVALSAPAYAREFTQYNQAIDEKRMELVRLTTDNPELYKEFSTDLDRLEKSYSNLRSELPQAPNQEALIQAMIQNLQWQVELLNQQLTILQRIKQADKRHENNPIS
ncbi:hypothetical protein [Arundinibacter roseus]|uniref:Anti-sigma factor n=1 Tax=Arundinibacter roseus TaxID=2070510 RepID=A0A4R4K2X8_9BACT|nr:hypothetical protein [Arundinibacter roseus]TDB60826.1 hypothetical protein EZE20_20490 [Arundinibacter roseus]